MKNDLIVIQWAVKSINPQYWYWWWFWWPVMMTDIEMTMMKWASIIDINIEALF